MRALTLPAIAVAAVLTVAGCSSTASSPAPAAVSGPAAPSGSPSPAAPPKGALTAVQALAELAKLVPSAKQNIVITEDNDKNHLLGRPGQYTSKVTFTDSRVKPDDIAGLDKDDVQQGGIIEVFATPADAKARGDYIQAIVKNLPMLLEYDYPHGVYLVRVSKYLTPSQAAEYDKAGAALG